MRVPTDGLAYGLADEIGDVQICVLITSRNDTYCARFFTLLCRPSNGALGPRPYSGASEGSNRSVTAPNREHGALKVVSCERPKQQRRGIAPPPMPRPTLPRQRARPKTRDYPGWSSGTREPITYQSRY